MQNIIIKPQPGPQTQFMATQADIAIGGGAAGGGKSYSLVMKGAQVAMSAPGSNTMVFRRVKGDLFNVGSFYPESEGIYPHLGLKYKGKPHDKWIYEKNGSVIQLKGLHTPEEVERLRSSQIDLALIDEGSQLTASQFWKIKSRMRSMSGNVKPMIRLVSNPEPNWLCDLIKWWLTDDGYADPEKSGLVRWIWRHDEVVHFFDSRREAVDCIFDTLGVNEKSKRTFPTSLTFIPSMLDDNPALLKNNPHYYANLCSLDTLDRKRLLEGNWFVKPTGKVFKMDDFQPFVKDPEYEVKIITCDTAQQTKTASDYTVMQVWGRWQNKAYLIASVRGKFDFMTQVEVMRNLYQMHKPHWVLVEQAANGLPMIQMLRREGVPMMSITRTKDKYSRAMDIQGYVQSGYVYLNRARPYYPELASELTMFSENEKGRKNMGVHDDQVDALVDGIYHLLYNKIAAPPSARKTLQEQTNNDLFFGVEQRRSSRPIIDTACKR